MPQDLLADVRLTTGDLETILGRSARYITTLCDLAEGKPKRIPCIRDGKTRLIHPLELAERLIAWDDTASAPRLIEHLTEKRQIDREEILRHFAAHGVSAEFFGARRPCLALVGFTVKQLEVQLLPSYPEEDHTVLVCPDSYDLARELGAGHAPKFVVIDLTGTGTDRGLGLLEWLRSQSELRKTRYLVILPEDGVSATLPRGIVKVQRPTDVPAAILREYPPAAEVTTCAAGEARSEETPS